VERDYVGLGVVKFQITEGPHVQIRGVRFAGNKAVDSAALGATITARPIQGEDTPVTMELDCPSAGFQHTLLQIPMPGEFGFAEESERFIKTTGALGDFDVPVMKTQTDACITWPHDLYDVWDTIAADAERIAVLYDHLDYHAARVWCEPQVDAAGIGVTLIYHIEEGPKGPMPELGGIALPWDY
jgi:hypothetical protein